MVAVVVGSAVIYFVGMVVGRAVIFAVGALVGVGEGVVNVVSAVPVSWVGRAVVTRMAGMVVGRVVVTRVVATVAGMLVGAGAGVPVFFVGTVVTGDVVFTGTINEVTVGVGTDVAVTGITGVCEVVGDVVGREGTTVVGLGVGTVVGLVVGIVVGIVEGIVVGITTGVVAGTSVGVGVWISVDTATGSLTITSGSPEDNPIMVLSRSSRLFPVA